MEGQESTLLRCVVCTNEIPGKRVRRGACTCGPECKKQLRHIRAALRDVRACRLCGARKRQRTQPRSCEPSSQLPLEAVWRPT